MKVLLTTLNSKYVHSNLALKYLYLAGKHVCDGLDIKEYTINNSRDYVFTELVTADYDAVCFSCYIWNIEKILELAADLKKARPQIQILLGGPEVSYDGEQVLRDNPLVDFVLAGEGENSFPQWCRALAGDIPFEQAAGLVYRSHGRIYANPVAEPVNLLQIPFPYETFPCETDRVIYYESSRGCPFGCSYCISSLDKRIRSLPEERVKADLRCFLDQNVKQVKFLDRTFNWDKARTLEIFQFLMDQDNGVTNFHFEICADLLDDELFLVLGQAREGLFQFEIGIQSTNGDTLSAVRRSSDTAAVLASVGRLVLLGNSHIHVDLIAGLPYEDYRIFRKSFNDVYALGADNLQLGFLKLLKGTSIRADEKKYGYVYMSKAPYQIISNQFLTAEEVCRLKQIETVLDLYYNRGGFAHTLSEAVSATAETPFDFYEALAGYYYAEGFQHRSHKKEDLYRILFQFFGSMGRGEQFLPLLERDLKQTMNFDAVKKFFRKGWTIL